MIAPAIYKDPPTQTRRKNGIAPHGTPTRYVHHKCRCAPCREAIRPHGQVAARRQAYGIQSDWEESLVSAAPARQYLRTLQRAGFGEQPIKKVSGVNHNTLFLIKTGRRTRIFPGTRDKILGVTLSDLYVVKDRAKVPANETLRLIGELHACGFSQRWIAGQIGQDGGGLQVARGSGEWVFVRTARRVQELHDRLWTENAEGYKGHRNAPGGKLYSGVRMREVCKCEDRP